VLRYYQDFFEHIHVDEFQDTDKIQYDIIKMLGDSHKHVFVVGDPDQSIYAFRGSHYENNLKFTTDFNATKIILEQNYRSTNHILEAANKLINHNQRRHDAKKLASDLGMGLEVTYMSLPTEYNEAYFVLNQIKQLQMDGYQYEDIAILYRNNSLSRIFEDALMKEGIPYIIYGGISFYERKEIKDMIAFIRVVLDPILDFYVKRIINVPRRGIGDVSIKKLTEHAKSNGISLYDAIDTLDISSAIQSKFKAFKDMMENLEDLLHLVIEKTEYIDVLKSEQDEISEDRILNIKELVSVFKHANQYYEGTFTSKLTQLLDQIALYTDKDKNDNAEGHVILSTIHQVKGLEFKAVFLTVMEEGVFPSDFSTLSPIEVEEERRVCYVGITRAKRKLFITNASKRLLYGQFKNHYPSRFIKEMRQKTIAIVEDEMMTSKFLSKGDKVTHNVFGDGVVITVEDDIATIAFPIPHGIKKILESHPALKKKALKN
jgi:DNA helicase-2/ATP-dependent DNA helicase PcrA